MRAALAVCTPEARERKISAALAARAMAETSGDAAAVRAAEQSLAQLARAPK